MKLSKLHLGLSALAAGILTVAGTVAVRANADRLFTPPASAAKPENILAQIPSGEGRVGRPIATASGPAEMALARHLKNKGAKMYGAFWCPHCHAQEELLGKEAFAVIDYIECDPRGKNARPELCKAAKITGYPTWQINGELYPGTHSLKELADLSGYQGDRKFKNVLPER